MKAGNALLIIFAISASWYGWTQYEAHQAAKKAAQDKTLKAMMEGYDRCTAPIYEQYPNPHDPDHDERAKVAQAAIASCRDFWFGRAPNFNSVDTK